MKLFSTALLFLAFTLSCQHKENNAVETVSPEDLTENSDSIQSTEDAGADTRVDKPTENMAANYSLVLSSNAHCWCELNAINLSFFISHPRNCTDRILILLLKAERR